MVSRRAHDGFQLDPGGRFRHLDSADQWDGSKTSYPEWGWAGAPRLVTANEWALTIDSWLQKNAEVPSLRFQINLCGIEEDENEV